MRDVHVYFEGMKEKSFHEYRWAIYISHLLFLNQFTPKIIYYYMTIGTIKKEKLWQTLI